MTGFLGEIACKLDSKGRLSMPAKLLKQMPPGTNDRFVINRGLEACLTLYTLQEWNVVATEMQMLNFFEREKRMFARLFLRGATELTVDASNRLLLPKRLIEYAGLEKQLILLGFFNRIEIWNATTFDEMMDIDPEEYAKLAKKVMGDKEEITL